MSRAVRLIRPIIYALLGLCVIWHLIQGVYGGAACYLLMIIALQLGELGKPLIVIRKPRAKHEYGCDTEHDTGPCQVTFADQAKALTTDERVRIVARLDQMLAGEQFDRDEFDKLRARLDEIDRGEG